MGARRAARRERQVCREVLLLGVAIGFGACTQRQSFGFEKRWMCALESISIQPLSSGQAALLMSAHQARQYSAASQAVEPTRLALERKMCAMMDGHGSGEHFSRISAISIMTS